MNEPNDGAWLIWLWIPICVAAIVILILIGDTP